MRYSGYQIAYMFYGKMWNRLKHAFAHTFVCTHRASTFFFRLLPHITSADGTMSGHCLPYRYSITWWFLQPGGETGQKILVRFLLTFPILSCVLSLANTLIFVVTTTTYLHRPTIVLGFALYYGQVLLAKFCFLQERGAYMALDNR